MGGVGKVYLPRASDKWEKNGVGVEDRESGSGMLRGRRGGKTNGRVNRRRQREKPQAGGGVSGGEQIGSVIIKRQISRKRWRIGRVSGMTR